MKTASRPSLARRIIGDILLALVAMLIAEVAVVMPARINAVVLKSDYQKVFVYQLILCAVLLLFAWKKPTSGVMYRQSVRLMTS